MLLDSLQIEIPTSTLSMASRSMPTEDYERLRHTKLFKIVYESDGLKINGYLALPPQQEALLPAIQFNRGGTERGALTPESAAAFLGLYASWGYVAIATQYRGSGGSEGNPEWGAGDVRDAMKLLEILKSFEYVDADRIGVIGGSRGGMVTLQMLRQTEAFRAAITFGAPTAFGGLAEDAYIRRTMSRYLPEQSNYEAEAAARSSSTWADELSSSTPLLVLHGTGDKKVHPEHGYRLGLALQEALHPYKLVMYENADHVLAGRRKESNEEMRAWMDRYVKNKGALPKVGPHGN